MRVLIAVTHLLGAGHLTRAAALARAFAAAGHEAVLVSGGAPAPMVRHDGVRLVQLPPLRILGTDFSRPVGPDGRPAQAEFFARRRALLLETLEAHAPHAVITELFPFGRRALAEEFLALIAAARAQKTLLLASVRDILVAPDKPEKIAQAHARLADLYDAVLVHGDPALVPLDASWPLDSRAAGQLRYTGYIDEGAAAIPAGARGGVLVAAGSSAAGLGLFRAAAEAARLRPDLVWRILIGHGVPDSDLSAIGHGLPAGVVTRARPDYRALLAGSALSVSQCGYNTAMDLLATGTPSVLVPFEAGRETEQRLRAERLAASGLARVLPEADLTAGTLLAAIRDGLAAPPPRPHAIDLDGAVRSVRIVETFFSGRLRGRNIDLLHDRGLKSDSNVTVSKGLCPLAGFQGGALNLFQGSALDPQKVSDLLKPGFITPVTPHGPPDPPARKIPRPDPPAFDGLRRTLDRAAENGLRVPVWWRDDDAVAATPALDRLLGLAEAHAAPILIAAISARVEPSLGDRLEKAAGACIAVHGLAHDDHAPRGEKPAEFGPHRPLAQLAADAASALRIAREKLAGARLLPVFVPPWNRLAPDLAAALPGLGYRGLSAVPGPPVAGLVRLDATLDPIDWRGTRALRAPAALLADLAAGIARHPHRPVGLLTHHLAQDEAVWDFLAGLLCVLARHPAVDLRDPRTLFADAALDSCGSASSLPARACARVG